MDDFKSHSSDDATTTDTEPIDENAVVLASLLQELSFWEPSTPNSLPSDSYGNSSSSSSGLMRKSRSANDATIIGIFTTGVDTKNNHQRRAQPTSYNGSTTDTNSGERFNGNFQSTSSEKGYQQRQNILSYDNTDAVCLSDHANSTRHDDNQHASSLHNINTNGSHDTRVAATSGTQRQQEQSPGSPTLTELQERCFWNKAIDPTSGRTYYYDVRTRHTQWEKPREIRAIEKKIKKDQRLLDEKFFREMEGNLLASLARGECIPIRSRPEQNPQNNTQPTESGLKCTSATSDSSSSSLSSANKDAVVPQPNTTPIEETNGTGRIRTISCMNEHLLAQIQEPIQLQRVPSSSIAKSLEGRPPLPSRPAASSGSANAFSTAQSILNHTTNDGNHPFPPSSQQYKNDETLENDLQNYFTTANEDDDDLKLSPEEMPRKQQLPVHDDILMGEELLDGALMLADLEVSDDEDANNDLNGEHSNSNIIPAATGPQNSIPLPSQQQVASVPSRSMQPAVMTAPTKGKKADTNGSNQYSHIRRNTAGEGAILTTHMKGGTMEKPDIDSTIHVVCGVIRAHIEQSCQQIRPAPPPLHALNVNLDIFRDDYDNYSNGSTTQSHHRLHQIAQQKGNGSSGKLPSLEEIKEFYREFYQRSQMEFDAIIMSLIYVERLIKLTNGAVMPSPYNWASVVFSCMVLASKVWDDLSMWNIDFSNVSVNSGVLSPFSLKRINELELAVLACLNFAVAIPGSEYAKYYYLLRSMMIRGGLLDPFAAKQQLSTDSTIRLQDRTKHYEDSIAHHAEEENPRRRVRSVDWTS